MAFGNKLGVKLHNDRENSIWFLPDPGSIIVEMTKQDLAVLDEMGLDYDYFGEVISEPIICCGETSLTLKEALDAWTKPLESVFPTSSGADKEEKTAHKKTAFYDAKTVYTAKNKIANVTTVVFKNLDERNIKESVRAFEQAIQQAQILMFPGGFSAGDEPDGSGKFIATAFRNIKISDAVNDLLKKKDGLILGICNGFQAIIKLGLVPYGEIRPQTEDSPTLTTNHIGRHISKSVYTKVVTNQSPWLMRAKLGGIYAIPASHGEGRFVASEQWLKKLKESGQIATQYVDLNGNPTMNEDFNPNGSYFAIEGITSPDGRVLGKMAHSERIGDHVAINIIGEQNQYIFESGVDYFR